VAGVAVIAMTAYKSLSPTNRMLSDALVLELTVARLTVPQLIIAVADWFNRMRAKARKYTPDMDPETRETILATIAAAALERVAHFAETDARDA
jgi:hypothetical protein